MIESPRITALVTVYNEKEGIERAVRSLCAQTFGDFEILVVDDGSTDRTPEILRAIDDPRLRVLRRGRLGRAAALALGVEAALGDYVAILDADDEARPERFAKQVAFLETRAEVAWLGCGEERHDSLRGERAVRLYPTDDAAIRRMAARCIPYSHSGVMFRRSLLDEGLNYRAEVPYLIDFDLFLRIAERHAVANLPEALVTRHIRAESFFNSRFKRQVQNRALARMSASAVRRLGLPIWHLAFPAARLGYDLVPDRLKRDLRRAAGLREAF